MPEFLAWFRRKHPPDPNLLRAICPHKRRYEDYTTAETAAQTFFLDEARPLKELWAYSCITCQGVHLGDKNLADHALLFSADKTPRLILPSQH